MKLKPADLEYHGSKPTLGASIVYWPTPNLVPGFASISEIKTTNEGKISLLKLAKDPNYKNHDLSHRRSIAATQHVNVADLPKVEPTGQRIAEDAFGTSLHLGDKVLCSSYFMFNNAGHYHYNKSRYALVLGTITGKNDFNNLFVKVDLVRTIAKHGSLCKLEEYEVSEMLQDELPPKVDIWNHLKELKAQGILVLHGHNPNKSATNISVPKTRVLAYRASGIFFKRRLLF